MKRLLTAYLTIAATLFSAGTALLMIHQGRASLPTGRVAIAVACLATIWFFYRTIQHPYVRAKPGACFGLIAASLIGVYGAAVLIMYSLQDKLLFVPVRGEFAHCENAKSLGYEVIDQKIGAERVRAYVHRTDGARAWMIIFHGNAESACRSFGYSENLRGLPLNAALIEYPGYQDDSIAPSQLRFTGNADAAFNYLVGDSKKLPVFLMGRSLGTGVATYVASGHPVQGLVLISPYTSIADVAAYQYPLLPISLLIRNPFPASEWARKANAPTLVLHGDLDRTIPISIGKEESEKFAHLSRFVTIPGADHNSILGEYAESTWNEIRGFIEERL